MAQIPFGVVKWLEFIWKADLPPHSKYLASYLRTFMNDKSDMAWPSYARIISETGLSRSTVAKYLEVLDAEGWLFRDKGNTGKNTVYHAKLPDSVVNDLLSNTSTPDELPSTCGELEVVRVANSNKQVNKQSNNQISFFSDVVDLYISIVKENCNAKGLFKDIFLNSKERLKPLIARYKENEAHKTMEFWENYFYRCSQIKWIKEGIDGEPVCTIDMLINKTKFYKNVEAFWS